MTKAYPSHELTLTFSENLRNLTEESIKIFIRDNVFDFRVRSALEYDDLFRGVFKKDDNMEWNEEILSEENRLKFFWNITKFNGT